MALGGIGLGDLAAERLAGRPLFGALPAAPTKAHPPNAATTTSTLKLLYANINSQTPDHQPLLDLIRAESPDIVLLAEVNAAWARSLAAITTDWPHRLIHDTAGQLRHRRLESPPPHRLAHRRLGTSGVPSIDLRVVVDGQPITILFTHPLPPVTAATHTAGNAQLLEVANIARARGPTVMMIGDFNATPWATVYSRALAASGLRDSAIGRGWQPSWPTGLPAACRIPIDHCWYGPALVINDRRLGPAIGSDHLPLIVEVAY